MLEVKKMVLLFLQERSVLEISIVTENLGFTFLVVTDFESNS